MDTPPWTADSVCYLAKKDEIKSADVVLDALDIGNVHDVDRKKERERDGFSELVLPEGHRNIVRSLVKTFANPSRSSSNDTSISSLPQHTLDVVHGKGQGLIILLHGVPGVGDFDG